MKTVLVGDGPRTSEVLAALQSHPGTTVSGRVSRHGSQGGVPVYPTLTAALGPVTADLVVLTGEIDSEDVAAAATNQRPILLADAAAHSEATVGALQKLAAGEKARVFLQRDADYGASATLRRFLASGRLGPIGHLSCDDRRTGAPGSGDGGRYWLSRGGPLLAQVCALLGTGARDVMARIDDDHGVTEAYVETLRGIHVHYSGGWRALADSHCLWIEGAKGSLRTDGGQVWWRNRGWRFFVPVRLGGTPGAATLRATLDRVVAEIERGGVGDRQALGIAGAALASAGSRQVVAIANPGRAVAA